MDDRFVAAEDRLDQRVPDCRPVSDTRVQADLRCSAEREEEGPLLSRDERFHRVRNSHHRHTGMWSQFFSSITPARNIKWMILK